MGAGSNGCVVVLCTAPVAAAPELARALVEARLCACVNVIPGGRSYFWWEGKVDEAHEALLVIKTTTTGLEALQGRLSELHPYDVPELVALDVKDGLPAYLAWVVDSVKG